MTDLAYLAGLIDGEGCIQLLKRKDGCIATGLTILMTRPEPLYWAEENFGGRVYLRQPQGYRNRREIYQWMIGKTDACCDLLQKLLPYLKVKGSEARVLLVLDSLRKTKKHRWGKRASPEAEDQLASIMLKLKKTGGAPTEEIYQEALDLCVYLRGRISKREREHDLNRTSDAATRTRHTVRTGI